MEKNSFQFLNDAEILNVLEITKNELKDTEDILNIYAIREDFLSEEGSDEMGILKHQHFNKEECNNILKKGLKRLKQSFNYV